MVTQGEFTEMASKFVEWLNSEHVEWKHVYEHGETDRSPYNYVHPEKFTLTHQAYHKGHSFLLELSIYAE